MRQPWLKLICLSLLLIAVGGSQLAGATQGDAFEPNNTVRTAAEISLPFHSDALSISPSNDIDVYTFVIDDPGIVTLDVDANSLGSPLDSVLLLADAEGDLIDDSDDVDGFDPRIERLLDAGRYFVAVLGFSASSVGDYSLTIQAQSLGNCIEEHLGSGESVLWRLGTFEPGTNIQVLLFGPSGSDFDLFLHEITSQSPLLSVMVDRSASLGSDEIVNYRVQASSAKEYLAEVSALSGEAGGDYTLCWSAEAR